MVKIKSDSDNDENGLRKLSFLGLRELVTVPSFSRQNASESVESGKRTHRKSKQQTKVNIETLKHKAKSLSTAYAAIKEVREFLSPASYSQFISWLYEQNVLYQVVFQNRFPNKITHLKKTQLFAKQPLDKELHWASAFLLNYAEPIREFLELSHSFEQSLLLSDFDKCDTLLNRIQTAYGYSLWLIRNKISLLQTSQGLDAQKKYATTVREEAQPIVDYLTFHLSIRNESTVSPALFKATVDYNEKMINVKDDLSVYLRFHCFPDYQKIQINELADILRHEFSGSIIDYYETFVTACRILVASKDDVFLTDLKSAAYPLYDRLQDKRLAAILFEVDGEGTNYFEHFDDDPFVLNSFEEYLQGNYESAWSKIKLAFAEMPNHPAVLAIAARCCSIVKPAQGEISSTLYWTIISKMAVLINKEAGYEEALTELLRLSLNYRSVAWADTLLCLVDDECSAEADLVGRWDARFAATGTAKLFPTRIYDLSTTKLKQTYARQLHSRTGDRLAAEYGFWLAGMLENSPGLICKQEEALSGANIALVSGNSREKLLNYSQMLTQSQINYYCYRGVRLKCYYLMSSMEIHECVVYIADNYVTKPDLIRLLPVAPVAEAITKTIRKQLRAEICLPIFFDVYLRHIGNQLNSVRMYAYEDFLFSHGLKKPSELQKTSLLFPRDKLIYFLKHVCIESVMDSSRVFSNSKEVAEERLAVCRLLTDLDPLNAQSYHSEIKDILRRLIVKKGMREIEQSRIYVDTESIRKTAKKTLQENYNRYIAFLKQVAPDESSSDVDEIDDILHHASIGNIEGLSRLALPKNEMNGIFETLVVKLRDEFVSSTEHGLDGYLSVRIRHGTLSGQLRRPLEDANLITQRDPVTGDYQRNEYWLSRASSLSGVEQDKLSSRLNNFAKNFDELVRIITSEWIQVKREFKGIGLFDFTLTRPWLRVLSSRVKPETQFDDFLNIAFEELGSILDLRLEDIRRVMDTEAKRRVNDFLTSLQTDVERINPDSASIREIVNMIGAVRTDMQVTFDRIIQWFKRSSTVANEPFLVEDAVNISLESVKAISSRGISHSIEIADELQEIKLHGRLATIVDILFILFENMVRYSGTPAQVSAYVKISVPVDRDIIHFRVENDVADEIISPAAIQRLESIKSDIKAEHHMRSVTTEGGTGLHKIAKMLKYDFMSGTPEMDFGYIGKRFFADFSLPIRTLELES